MTEYLWQWLDETRGYEVDGEVSLGSAGRIDLVARTPDKRYLGFEVKDQAHFGVYGDDTDLFRQLLRYRDSGYLDKIYYCSKSPGTMVDHLRRSIDIEFNPPQRTSGPSELGGIRIGGMDEESNAEPRCEIIRTATDLPRSHKPTLTRTSESWVNHCLWKAYGWAREGVFPNRSTGTEQYVDIISFHGSSDPTEIYLHQDQQKYALEGYEAKGNVSLGQTVLNQLQDQYESGGLTALSLAVPKQRQKEAEKLLASSEQASLDQFGQDTSREDRTSWLSDIGLVTVDTAGNVQFARRPTRLEMTIDGFQSSEKNGRFITVGWGRTQEKEELASIYDSNTGY